MRIEKTRFIKLAWGRFRSWHIRKPVRPGRVAIKRIKRWPGGMLRNCKSLFIEPIRHLIRPRFIKRTDTLNTSGGDLQPALAGDILNTEAHSQSDLNERVDQQQKPGSTSTKEHQLEQELEEDIFSPRKAHIEEPNTPKSEAQSKDQTSASAPTEEGVDEKIPSTVPQEANSSQPQWKTMLDALPNKLSSSQETTADFLSESIEDIFRKSNHADPRIKKLLNKHDKVDLRDLANELRQFASSIGALSKKE